MRTLCVAVDDDFHDAWFEETATPRERTAVLRFACSLPRTQPASEGLDRLRDVLRDEAVRLAQEECAQARERACASDAALARAELTGRRAHEEEVEELRVRLERATAAYAEEAASAAERLRLSLEAESRATAACLALERRVAELETPAWRGRVGEACLADLLHEAGFDVEDTRAGQKKLEGHLDFLARPRAQPSLRIAVECKNRDVLKAADLDSFERHVREGLASDLFDSAILVSWRAPHRRATGIEWLNDADGNPTVPVSYLAPSRAHEPLTEEAILSHVCLHGALAVGCVPLRKRLAVATEDGASASLRKVYDVAVEELSGVLEDMGRQSRLLGELRATVRGVRTRAARLLDVVCESARAVDRDPSWLEALHKVVARMSEGDRDALVWNRLLEANERHELTEALGDRETVLATARSFAKRARNDGS